MKIKPLSFSWKVFVAFQHLPTRFKRPPFKFMIPNYFFVFAFSGNRSLIWIQRDWYLIIFFLSRPNPGCFCQFTATYWSIYRDLIVPHLLQFTESLNIIMTLLLCQCSNIWCPFQFNLERLITSCLDQFIDSDSIPWFYPPTAWDCL